MKRAGLVSLLIALPLVLLTYWIASHTYWAEMKVPMPPKGEALTNPFYAVQRFAEALGARTTWDRVFVVPPTESVIVLSAWHWSLSSGRRAALERWVESGGRLVVDRLAGGEDDFERWSGIVRQHRDAHDARRSADPESDDACRTFEEEREGSHAPGGSNSYSMCDVDCACSLTSNRRVLWALRDASGIQAMRVPVGQGSVTMINASPFRYRSLFDGDHASVFVAATGLRRDDDVHFLSEDNHPSLLALIWLRGAPAVTLTLALVALLLWRGAVRFGPLAAPQSAARRSLAEQIRGTGQFTLRHGGGTPLHNACVRALDEAAERRVKGYARRSADDRAAVLARLTGFDRQALAAAIHQDGAPSAHELRRAIAVLEVARRQILNAHTRSSHGTC